MSDFRLYSPPSLAFRLSASPRLSHGRAQLLFTPPGASFLKRATPHSRRMASHDFQLAGPLCTPQSARVPLRAVRFATRVALSCETACFGDCGV